MVIGPRIWKTGIAVALCIFLVQSLNLGPPLLAIVAAILTIQPSITKSIAQGGNRVAATIIGGIIGFIIVNYFGAHPITVGLAVILAITISIRLKLQEGIVIAAITVAAVMVDVTGDPKLFALHRLIETLVGIGVGVGVNLVFSPPNTEKTLIEGLTEVNQHLKNLYVTVLNGFISNNGYDQEKLDKEITEVRGKLEDIRRKMFEFKDEIGYRKVLKSQQVKKYETVVTSFNLIFERILGIYYTELNRSQRDIDIEGASKEYRDILETLQKLLTTTVSMQENLLCYLTSKNVDLCLYLENCGHQSTELVKDLRWQINKWHLTDENKNNSVSLMEISNIGYEMEQINHHLKRITGALKQLIEGETVNSEEGFIKWLTARVFTRNNRDS
ncbi:FUSC family protein [Desulfitibacter alkalitolerans]|uniref:FUSC family protein n=1 Tax=Desulfitibacter alkalitolerans TaxID=264641 RepID=UPI000688A6AB|nr:aromatic acid exporter family protein [Desulfitibacter alkalitolerans]